MTHPAEVLTQVVRVLERLKIDYHVLRKLEWYRAGGEVSDAQWRDVLGVLVASAGRRDDAHRDRSATELGVADLLARARAQARRV